MSKICQVTGVGPMSGNNVSHSNKKTRRRFLPNLHWHRFWLAKESRYVRLLLSTRGIRTIDKYGIEDVLAKLKAKGQTI